MTYIANKALTDELTRRMRLLDAADLQMAKQNYGLARKLLAKVRCEPLKIGVMEE